MSLAELDETLTVGYRLGMLRTIALLLTCLFPLAAVAEVTGYKDCITGLERDPEQGLTDALQWRDLGGGAAALHCVALGYVATGQHRIAATRIEELAYMIEGGNKQAAGEVMAQAGAVWLQASEDKNAERAFAKALTWRPGDPRIHVDLAHVQASREAFKLALENAETAIGLDDLSADAYALQGMILRRLNRMDEADEATSTALALDPEQPQARMEQALAMARGGDMESARRELTDIVQDHPDGNIAETAQQMLQKLEQQ